MALPAIQLLPFTKGADPIDPATSDGWDSYAALVGPEPVAASALPIEPDLVESVELESLDRAVRGRSGAKLVSGFRGRARCVLAWTNVNPAQRLALLAYLRDECGGGEKAFPVVVDPDSGGGGGSTRHFRALADPSDTWVNQRNYTVRVECEEVYS